MVSVPATVLPKLAGTEGTPNDGANSTIGKVWQVVRLGDDAFVEVAEFTEFAVFEFVDGVV